MTETVEMTAELRAKAGKGTARQTRSKGRVPAVIYGNKEPPVMISLDFSKFSRIIHRPGFFTHIYAIKVGEDTYKVLARDLQLDPVSDKPIHADFLRVSDTTEIIVKVPCDFVNSDQSPGLKRGGVLNVVRHDIELVCLANSIPEHITVNLAGTNVGDSIHISAVALPEGVRPTITDRDFTIATIAAPSGLKSEDNAAAA